MEALAALHTTMSRQESSPGVLDADSSGCVDTLDQSPLWAQRPVCTATLPRWLQAGVSALGSLTPTDTGTPQGGGLSPLRAQVARDGRARLCDADDADGRPQAPALRRGNPKGIAVIRYAAAGVRTAPPGRLGNLVIH
jgi:hypothetical protein